MTEQDQKEWNKEALALLDKYEKALNTVSSRHVIDMILALLIGLAIGLWNGRNLP